MTAAWPFSANAFFSAEISLLVCRTYRCSRRSQPSLGRHGLKSIFREKSGMLKQQIGESRKFGNGRLAGTAAGAEDFPGGGGFTL